MSDVQTISIDGVDYVRKDSSAVPTLDADGMPYVIVRSNMSGVHAGYLMRKIDKEVILRNSRRLYYWTGAATLSQLSQEGVSKPSTCRFPCIVPEITVTEVEEVIPTSECARLSIAAVKVWSE